MTFSVVLDISNICVCVCVCVCIKYIISGGVLVAKPCLTLETPWTVACQAPLHMEFSRQESRILKWVAISSPQALPN